MTTKLFVSYALRGAAVVFLVLSLIELVLLTGSFLLPLALAIGLEALGRVLRIEHVNESERARDQQAS